MAANRLRCADKGSNGYQAGVTGCLKCLHYTYVTWHAYVPNSFVRKVTCCLSISVKALLTVGWIKISQRSLHRSLPASIQPSYARDVHTHTCIAYWFQTKSLTNRDRDASPRYDEFVIASRDLLERTDNARVESCSFDAARDQANVSHSERRVDLLPRVNVNSYRPIKTDYPHFVLFPLSLSLSLSFSLAVGSRVRAVLCQRKIRLSSRGNSGTTCTPPVFGAAGANDAREKTSRSCRMARRRLLCSPLVPYVRRNNTRYTGWAGIRGATEPGGDSTLKNKEKIWYDIFLSGARSSRKSTLKFVHLTMNDLVVTLFIVRSKQCRVTKLQKENLEAWGSESLVRFFFYGVYRDNISSITHSKQKITEEFERD